MSAPARRESTRDFVPGYPITYEPGDGISWTLEGRMYLGVVEDWAFPKETFEVRWWHTSRRGRFVHGGEPLNFRHALPGDRVTVSNQDVNVGRAAELSTLLRNYDQWPAWVRETLTARYRALTGTRWE